MKYFIKKKKTILQKNFNAIHPYVYDIRNTYIFDYHNTN